MKAKFIRLLAIVVVGCQLSVVSAFASTLDKILVIVNGETITQAELDVALEAVKDRLVKEAKGADISKQLAVYRKQILDRMIEEKLILSDAKKRNAKIDDREVEDRLKEVKSKFPSEEAFDAVMKEENVSLKELRQRYADQITITKMIDLEVRKKVVITPSEVLQYYEKHKNEFVNPEQAHVKNILIKVDADNDDEKAAALAEKIIGFLKAGESFDELALKYSKGPNADRGGDLGYIKRGQMIKAIDDVIFNMNDGQLSDVVKTDLGYHIFKLEEKKPEAVLGLNDVKDGIDRMLYSEKAKGIYDSWVAELKKNAYISYR